MKDLELDPQVTKTLQQIEKSFDRDNEIKRILNSFKLNAYEILGVVPGIGKDDIRKIYRSKSLLLHPDRNPGNIQASEAFDRLKKAQDELLEGKKREFLDETWSEARNSLMKQQNISKNDLKRASEPAFLAQVWERWKEILIKEELRNRRKRQIALAEEGRQRAKVESEILDKKAEAKVNEQWEATREHRIDGWRQFKKSFASKKKKGQLLG